MRTDFAILFAILVVAVIAVTIFSFNPIIPTPSNQIKKFSSYQDLQNFLKANIAESSYYGGTFTATQNVGAAVPTTAGQEAGRATGTSSEDYSTTNVQVAGVDEADIVKNDGKYIYTITGNKVVILDAYPTGDAKILSTIGFNETPVGIFVNKDRLVVFGNQYNYPIGIIIPLSAGAAQQASQALCIRGGCPPIPYYPPISFIYIYDISDRANPVLKRNITVDGSYFNSRMIGDYVYVVVNSYIDNPENVTVPIIYDNGVEKHIPATDVYYFDYPDNSYQFTTILSVNTQDDTMDVGKQEILLGATQNMFVSLNNIYIVYQKPFNYFDYQNKILDKAILPFLPTDVVSKIQSIRNSNIPKYEQMQNITQILQDYTESLNEDQRMSLEKSITQKMNEVQAEIQKDMQKTEIHRIAIDNGKIEYKSDGEVPGYVLNQFSMDESNGYFRIATTMRNFFGGVVMTTSVRTGVIPSGSGSVGGATAQQSASKISFQEATPQTQPPQSWNNVYVLDMNLKIVGKLEELAPDESIYSARFLGDRVYLVTFRRIDPLFVIDLSDPTNPKVLGKLKIPGFSDYLHPYDETHIIGIGKEVQDLGQFVEPVGLKLGLFDVSDPNNPKEIANYSIGGFGSDSEALHDHRAFLFSKDKNLLVIPVLQVDNVFRDFNIRPYTWQGAYVFDTSNNQFTLKGRITHAPSNTNETYYYYYGPYSVERSLYIDGVLYTISPSMVKMNDLQNLNEIKEIQLPFEQNQNIVPLIE